MEESNRHESLKGKVEELQGRVQEVVDHFEERTGIWVTSVKYFKSKQVKSCIAEITLDLK